MAEDSPEERPATDQPCLELDREDINRLKEIMRNLARKLLAESSRGPDPDWISFSSTEARWINFNSQMRAPFAVG